MFVVHFNINGENNNYYFNRIRNAKNFERKILLYVHNDIEKNEAKLYRNIYFYIKNIETIIINFDYNCDNDELKRSILDHENNDNIYDLESYVEEISILD